MDQSVITTLHVVVGLLFNEKNEVLIALRPPHVVQPGVWEFPGGKVEKHEALLDALIREYQEEIGIRILEAEFILKSESKLPGNKRSLILHTFRIVSYTGIAQGCENQVIRWIPISALADYIFPEANKAIVNHILQQAN